MSGTGSARATQMPTVAKRGAYREDASAGVGLHKLRRGAASLSRAKLRPVVVHWGDAGGMARGRGCKLDGGASCLFYLRVQVAVERWQLAPVAAGIEWRGSSGIATHHTRVYRSTALHDFIASTLEHPNLPIATPKVSFIATPIFQH